MKSFKITFVLIFGIFTLISCLKDDDLNTQPVASMLFVNAYTPTPSLNYFLDGNHFYNAAYKDARRYNNIAIGNRRLSVAIGNNVPVADTLIHLEYQTFYSSFIYGTTENSQFIVVKDDISINTDGGTGIRFLNLANGTEEVDFFLKEEKITSLSGRGQENKETMTQNQKFIPVNSGVTDIFIKDKSGNKLDSLKNVTLNPGYFHTFILLGIDGDENRPLDLIGF